MTQIDPMAEADWAQVRAIYQEGIASGQATFETAAPPWEEWDQRHLPACRLVARHGDRVVGWAALSPVSDRCSYGGTAEVSVYVADDARGRGVGRALLEALVAASEDSGLWSLQAGVFPENTASVALHRGCGFRVVGVQERVGQLQGRWHDVLRLERRSSRVGT